MEISIREKNKMIISLYLEKFSVLGIKKYFKLLCSSMGELRKMMTVHLKGCDQIIRYRTCKIGLWGK